MNYSYVMRVAAIGAAMVFGASHSFGQVSEETAGATPVAETPRKVDLNTADIPALESVPEIGTEFANAVVSGRPYKSVDDLKTAVKLPPEKMASLRAKVWVSPPKTAASTPAGTTAPVVSKPSPKNDGKATPRQDVTERYDRANPSPAKTK